MTTRCSVNKIRHICVFGTPPLYSLLQVQIPRESHHRHVSYVSSSSCCYFQTLAHITTYKDGRTVCVIALSSIKLFSCRYTATRRFAGVYYFKGGEENEEDDDDNDEAVEGGMAVCGAQEDVLCINQNHL